ncbi:SF3B1 [Cordylochernes scorpioides]|uniref:SF3B1 n=1 Tax=Cordylochernes scorpioides TaxID=51811 RepID=A0ABY6KHR4_9ARAC|nr:SF3B1 [Cordylochernes scorpioides]
MNSDLYCDILVNKLKPGIRNKRRVKLSKGVLFLHDDARPHTSCKTVSTIIKLGFEVLEHPAYSPDLAPPDYFLFGLLKKELKRKQFDSDEDVQKVVQDFFTRFLRVPIKRIFTSCQNDGDDVTVDIFGEARSVIGLTAALVAAVLAPLCLRGFRLEAELSSVNPQLSPGPGATKQFLRMQANRTTIRLDMALVKILRTEVNLKAAGEICPEPCLPSFSDYFSKSELQIATHLLQLIMEPVRTHEEIEAQIKELQSKRANMHRENGDGVPLTINESYMDQDIYGSTGKSKFEGYATSIAANDDADMDDDDYEGGSLATSSTKKTSYVAPKEFFTEAASQDRDYDPFADRRIPKIGDRLTEDSYRAKRFKLMISPPRFDPFADGGKTPDDTSRTYQVIMREQALNKDQNDLRKKLHDKAKAGELKPVASSNGEAPKPARKRRWDDAVGGGEETPKGPSMKKTSWDTAEAQTPSQTRWDETPGRVGKGGSETPGATPSSRVWDTTPGHATPGAATPGHTTPSARRNRWDETPKTERETPGHWAETPRTDRGDLIQDTPTPSASKRRSRWDETPASQMGSHTPQTPSMMTPSGVTPTGAKAMAMATPTPGHIMAMTPEQLQAYRWEREIDERNRHLSDDELEALFPPGYKVLPPPHNYHPIRTPARKLTATPTPLGGVNTGFFMQKD